MQFAIIATRPANPYAQPVQSLLEVLQRRMRQAKDIYRETRVRAQYRALFDAASALSGTFMQVKFIKNDNTVRTMVCQACPADTDQTRRYVTVWDVEQGGFRRIALDSVLELTVTTRAA